MTRITRLTRGLLAGGAALALVALTVLASQSRATASAQPHHAAHTSQGGTDQFLPASKIVLKNAISVNLTQSTVRLPLHRGAFHGTTVWYIITDTSDFGISHDLGALYAPKLTNLPIGCPQCVQTVTLTTPPNNKFHDAIVNFQGIPDFSPRRILNPGKMGFPPVQAQPGAVGDAHYSPFIRFPGSPVVYNAPIVATGNGPFDVMHHANTNERVIAIDTHQTLTKPATVDMLLVEGFDAGQPILYLNTEASDPVAATYERTTYVPLLNGAPFLGGDDFLGSARERIFVFANGQTSGPNAQGENYAGLHGGSLDANVNTLSRIADPENVQGDWPTLADPVHANAYSPLWDVQLGQWSARAIRAHENTRQTDEFQVLQKSIKPDTLTGLGGVPYGSVGFLVNCPPVAFINQPPTRPQAANPLFG